MLHHSGRSAPAVLASLLAIVCATTSTRAEPAQAAAASTPANAAADCLANPTGPTTPGSHWYYRIDRPTGRHCWYQRQVGAAESANAQPHSAAEPAVQRPVQRPVQRRVAPTNAPVSDTPPNGVADTADGGQSVATPVAPAPNTFAWPAPIPVPLAESTAPQSAEAAADEAAAAPASGSSLDPPATEPAPVAVPAPLPSAQPPSPARAVVSNEISTHLPALLGIGLAISLIVLGSFGIRLISDLSRARRRRSVAHPLEASWIASLSTAQDSPGIVPVMPAPRRTDVAHPKPEPEASRQADPTRPAPPSMPNREKARVLEENVRELLRRLRTDLPTEPRDLAPRAAPAQRAPHPRPPAGRAPSPDLDTDRGLRREGRR